MNGLAGNYIVNVRAVDTSLKYGYSDNFRLIVDSTYQTNGIAVTYPDTSQIYGCSVPIRFVSSTTRNFKIYKDSISEGNLLDTFTGNNYNGSWDTTDVPGGQYTIIITAVSGGNTTTLASVTTTVADTSLTLKRITDGHVYFNPTNYWSASFEAVLKKGHDALGGHWIAFIVTDAPEGHWSWTSADPVAADSNGVAVIGLGVDIAGTYTAQAQEMRQLPGDTYEPTGISATTSFVSFDITQDHTIWWRDGDNEPIDVHLTVAPTPSGTKVWEIRDDAYQSSSKIEFVDANGNGVTSIADLTTVKVRSKQRGQTGQAQVHLVITWYSDDGSPIVMDCWYDTQVELLDIRTDSNNDGAIDDNDDIIEENSPGRVIRKNDDDDDNDTMYSTQPEAPYYDPNRIDVLDKDENYVDGEDDLTITNISCPNGIFPSCKLRLEVINGVSKVKAWVSDKKITEIPLPKVYDLDNELPPNTIYLEGYNLSETQGDITLKLTFIRNNEEECKDAIKLTVAKVSFEPNDPNQKYGFDNLSKECRGYGYTYDVWKSVSKDNSEWPWLNWDTMIANIAPSDLASNIYFGNLFPEYASVDPVIAIASPQLITIIGNIKGGTEIYGNYGRIDGYHLGNIKILVYPKLEYTLGVVIAKNGDNDPFNPPITKDDIEEILNGIYKQAVIQWTVNWVDTMVSDYDINRDGMLGYYKSPTGWIEESTLRNQFNNFISDLPTCDYYLIVVQRSAEDGLYGSSMMGDTKAIVFCEINDYANNQVLPNLHLDRTIGHELGHILGMEHTPDDFWSASNFYLNLMYPNGGFPDAGKLLFHDQWNLLNNPWSP